MRFAGIGKVLGLHIHDTVVKLQHGCFAHEDWVGIEGTRTIQVPERVRDALPAIHAAIGIYVEASAPAEGTAAIGKVLEVFAKVTARARNFGEVEQSYVNVDIFIDYLRCAGSRGGVLGNGVGVAARLEVFKGILPGIVFRAIKFYHGIAYGIAGNIRDVERQVVGCIRNLAEEESGVGTGTIDGPIIDRIGKVDVESAQGNYVTKLGSS